MFRDVVGRFASGVTIVSTRVGERDFGTTASAFSSLSLDPPMILVCLNQTSDTGSAIRRSRFFAVSVLRDDQQELARRFAVKSETKFEGLDIERGTTGAPLFSGALAHVQCRVIRATQGGTHTVFLAEALEATGCEGRPLTYFRGQFGRFEDALQCRAYDAIRSLITSRKVASGSELSVDRLAVEQDFEPDLVVYALRKLQSDGLVERDPAGTYRAASVDGQASVEALEARCAIELAVVDLALGDITEADLLELRTYASLAQTAADLDPPDVAGLTSVSVAFHERFIGLLGNSRVESFYHGLTTSSIWRRALSAGEYINPAYLTELVDACAEQDADRARRAIADHFAEVSEVVSTAMDG
jgi:flavin reductase (DIM6/NTAB) family NADH-FMN oxidoreductase RutF/DNA-binding GntR family transcriptional regulator